MTVPRIDELRAPPAVGKTYLVPTVRYRYFGIDADWPVIGPKHVDPELGFLLPHYHVDARFVPAALERRLVYQESDLNYSLDAVVGHVPLSSHDFATGGTEPHPEPIWRRRRCRRAETSYQWGRVDRIQQLRDLYSGRRLIETPCGRICPHKGARVDTLVPDADGLITCPLHGLRFNAAGECIA